MESHFKFDRFVVLFASPSGRTLSLYGNERIIETFENLGVCESVNLSERFAGTNAPAVCLVEQKPTTVLGAEHYFKDFHWAECAAAPVLDYQRRFLGCLGVTTTSESRIVLESLVEYFCWLATTMTMEFFVEEKLQKLEIQDTFFRSTFERADQCLLLVDRGGEILDVNLYGQKLLGVFERGATRRNFRELLRSPHIDRPLSSLHKTHHLVKPLPPARTNEPLLMEAVPLFSQSGDERAYLLRISPKNKRPWSAPTPGASVRNLITFDHIVAEDTKSSSKP